MTKPYATWGDMTQRQRHENREGNLKGPKWYRGGITVGGRAEVYVCVCVGGGGGSNISNPWYLRPKKKNSCVQVSLPTLILGPTLKM